MNAPIRDVAALVDATQRGQRIKYLFFWGHQGRPDGEPDKSCFSQWWPAPFEHDGETFATAEHWMMAGKARLFGDEATRQAILKAPHPKKAKELGRAVTGFDETVWVERRFDLVVEGNLLKFGSHPKLAEYLLGTGERVLVEASPVDRIWGIGIAADHPDAERPEAWKGLNLLGFALMEVRDRLRRSHDAVRGSS